MRRLIICFILILSGVSSFAQSKQKADMLYSKDQFSGAAEIYESILRKQGESAEIYYNLGNCYYKMNEIPLAILNYERALLLSPADDDVRANLVLARSKTIDKAIPPTEMFFVTWWKSLVNCMSINAWTYLALISFVFCLVGLLVYLFMSSITMRKTGLYGAFFLFIIVIVANLAAYAQSVRINERTTAIIIAPAVSVKSSPSDNSTDLFIIHEGTKVDILDNSLKGWREVKFEEGKQGWIPKDAIEVI